MTDINSSDDKKRANDEAVSAGQTSAERTSMEQTRAGQTSEKRTSMEQTRAGQTSEKRTSMEQTRAGQTSEKRTSMEQSGGQRSKAEQAIGRDDPELDPFEIEFLPEFREGRGPREPFVNKHGVVIGDYMYESDNSPLEQWSVDTDPSVMAGDHWVHPYKDIGFHTAENKDYFEHGIPPQSGIYMHPDKDAAYEAYRQEGGVDSEQDDERQP